MKKKLAVLDKEIHTAKQKHSEIITQAQIRFRSIVTSIHQRKILIIRTRVLVCVFCKKNSQVRFWGFIQKHLYVPPRGWIEQGQWVPKGVRTCALICPKCSYKNNIDTHPQREKITDLINRYEVSPKDLFKTVWNQNEENNIRQVFPVP